MYAFQKSGVVVVALKGLDEKEPLRPLEKRALSRLAEAVRRNPNDARLDPTHEQFRNFVVEVSNRSDIAESWFWRGLAKIKTWKIVRLPEMIARGELDLSIPAPIDGQAEWKKVLAARDVRAGGAA